MMFLSIEMEHIYWLCYTSIPMKIHHTYTYTHTHNARSLAHTLNFITFGVHAWLMGQNVNCEGNSEPVIYLFFVLGVPVDMLRTMVINTETTETIFWFTPPTQQQERQSET